MRKYIEANVKDLKCKPVYFRTAFRKVIESGLIVAGSSGGMYKATEAATPKPAKKKVAKKATTKKKKKKKKTGKGSDYKTIKGKKYDKGMLDEADAAVAGANDNVISQEEASKILKEALDGHVYTATEKATMKYIRDNYTFTAAADKLVRASVAKFAAKKAAKAKKPTKKAASKAKKPTKKKPVSKKKPATKKKPAAKKKTTKKK